MTDPLAWLHRLAAEPEVGLTSLRVACCLAANSTDGRVAMTTGAVADELGLARSTTQVGLYALVQSGWLVPVHRRSRGGNPTTYTMSTDRPCAGGSEPGTDRTTDPTTDRTPNRPDSGGMAVCLGHVEPGDDEELVIMDDDPPTSPTFIPGRRPSRCTPADDLTVELTILLARRGIDPQPIGRWVAFASGLADPIATIGAALAESARQGVLVASPADIPKGLCAPGAGY